MTEKAEPTNMQVAAGKAIKTAKTATTLAKAHLARESNKHGGRWHWVDFPGPNGRESAGIVDILAIRKRWELSAGPEFEKLKHLDLFDIMLIQVKGGECADSDRRGHRSHGGGCGPLQGMQCVAVPVE